MSNLFLLVFALVCSLVSIPVVRLVARKLNVWSIIDSRRPNKRPVPLLGGVAIALTFGLGSFIYKSEIGIKLFICALPMIITSILDDAFELSARLKLISQVVAASLWLAWQPPGTLLLDQLGINSVFVKAISILWIVGVTNGFNLIDGMDGVVGGVTIIFAFFLSFIAPQSFNASMILLAGSMAGFLFYNFPPARIYLGDSGSTLAGFILASSCAILKMPLESRANLMVPLLLLSYPLLDTTLAMTRRALRGKNIFSADDDHLHHRLKRLGLGKLKSLAIIYSVSLYTGYSAYQMWMHTYSDKLMILFLSSIPLMGIVGLIYFSEKTIMRLNGGKKDGSNVVPFPAEANESEEQRRKSA